MVVAAGVTLTAVPLVAAMLPGVMTPVPSPNTPVRPELVPATIDGGVAAKLVMKAAGGGGWLLDEPPHPDRDPKARLSAMAGAA